MLEQRELWHSFLFVVGRTPYWVGGLSRLTLCKVVSRGRAHGDSAYKLVRASSWKSSHPGKQMGIPK